MNSYVAFLLNWHVKKKSAAETQQMDLLPRPSLATAHVFFHIHLYISIFSLKTSYIQNSQQRHISNGPRQ